MSYITLQNIDKKILQTKHKQFTSSLQNSLQQLFTNLENFHLNMATRCEHHPVDILDGGKLVSLHREIPGLLRDLMLQFETSFCEVC